MGRNNILGIYPFRLFYFLDYEGINFSTTDTPTFARLWRGDKVIIKDGVINKVGMIQIFYIISKNCIGI